MPKKVAMKRIPSDQPTALIAPSDYEHIFKGDEDESKPKCNKSRKSPSTSRQTSEKNKATQARAAAAVKGKRVPSDQPTALIAPSDYEHIFNEEGSNAKAQGRKNKPGQTKAPSKAKRIASDQPTALIAPSDYELIFKGEDDEMAQSTKQGKNTGNISKGGKVVRVPSDQPTALIAPSDYEHIFQDPDLAQPYKGHKVKNQVKQAGRSETKQYGSVERGASRPRQQAPLNQAGETDQEILPASIQRVVKVFLAKQPKTYTIHTDGQ